ncbi:MAG: hypothetical protein ACRD3K_03575 [Edaphobacter sp.]
MQATICRHIKTNGRQCKSPSLGLSAFCYFHSRLHRRHRNLVENSSPLIETGSNPAASASGAAQTLPDYAAQDAVELDLPPVEDAESIQVALSLLIAALARNRITAKRAAVLLYGLQLASTNARSITIEPSASSIARALTRTKSGLDLAVRDTEPAGKRNVRYQTQPAPALAEIPGNVSYNENL